MQSLRPIAYAILTSSMALACAVEPNSEGSVETVDQSIINGTLVTSENIGLVKILTASGSGCSGTLIAPEWVLTAQHCLPTDPTGTTVERTTTGEIRNAVQVIPWSNTNFTTDVGLIRVNTAFPISVGPDGYTNPLWPFAVTDLVGRTVECYGYGANSADGSGWGTLRHASLPVESYDAGSSVYYLRPNALGQIPYYGDSGSGCFYTEGGTRYQISVLSTVSTEIAGVVAAGDVRAWVDLQVHSRCDDQIQSGTETGIDCGGSCAACPAPAVLTLTSQWDTGWCAEVVITNYTASPTNSWSVDFDVNESVVYAQWSAQFTSTGPLYTATNLPWNGNIPSKGTARFGFCANKAGANWQPELVSTVIH